MKKIIMMIMIILLVGCQDEAPVESTKEIVRNVKVVETVIDNHQYYESYIGRVNTSGVVKKSFQVDGKVAEILISVGDTVAIGDVLVTLDRVGLQYALDAANSELSAANAQYSKALEGLDYAKNLYNNTLGLYNEGVASQFEMDQATLNYNISGDDVNGARAMKNQASTNVQAKSYLLDNSELITDRAGIVMDILVEEGELTGAGYPAVVLRDSSNEVIFGVSAKDLDYVEIDEMLTVIIDDKKMTGNIKTISQIPDQTTQTYEVSISLNHDAAIGQIVKILLPTKTVEGSKIPLGAIRSDGEDYVYIDDSGKVLRVNVEVVGIFNQEVVVTGLPEKSALIIEGIMNLISGDKVKVVE